MDESGFWFIQEDAYQGDHASECAEKASVGAISQPLDMASTAAAEMRMPFERVASFLARPDSIPRGYPRLPIPPLAERGPGMMYELNQEQYKKIMSEVASAGRLDKDDLAAVGRLVDYWRERNPPDGGDKGFSARRLLCHRPPRQRRRLRLWRWRRAHRHEGVPVRV